MTDSTSAHEPRRRLGRGLNALLGGGGADDPPLAPVAAPSPPSSSDETRASDWIDVDLIEQNPYQPRNDIGDETLEELASSIRQHGVLQPLLVRSHDGGYQLIAGQRRWLAARKVGLRTVPCRLLELDDRQVNEVAIEENLKREDLNDLDKAKAFQDYLQRFGSTIEELAQRLSLNRATVSNTLRLLELPDEVKQRLRTGKITAGHARAILSLSLEDQVAVCDRIQAEGLSVRKTEAEARAIQKGGQTVPFQKSPAAAPPEMTNHVRSIEQQLRDHFGTKVEIVLKSENAGRIVIHFESNDQFEQILRVARNAA